MGAGQGIFDADLSLRNKVHCQYLMGLGYLGFGNAKAEGAEKLFEQVLQSDTSHQGAIIHKKMIKHHCPIGVVFYQCIMAAQKPTLVDQSR